MSDPEEIFPPVRGGMVDTVRQQAMAEHQQAERAIPLTREDPGEYAAIRVRDEAPDQGIIRTVLLTAAQPVNLLLPRDDQRRSAVILAIDNDVFVTKSQGLANDVAGVQTSTQVGYFPAGIALPINNQEEWWVAATTTATNTRITVIVNRDSAR
jgi:hypothetical protein